MNVLIVLNKLKKGLKRLLFSPRLFFLQFYKLLIYNKSLKKKTYQCILRELVQEEERAHKEMLKRAQESVVFHAYTHFQIKYFKYQLLLEGVQ